MSSMQKRYVKALALGEVEFNQLKVNPVWNASPKIPRSLL